MYVWIEAAIYDLCPETYQPFSKVHLCGEPKSWEEHNVTDMLKGKELLVVFSGARQDC